MKTALVILGSLLCAFPSYVQASDAYKLSYAQNPPFAIVDDGKEQGVAIDVVRALFDRAGLSYSFQELPLVRGMQEAKDKTMACVFPVQRAQNIEADYKWISPILIAESGFFTSLDSNVKISALSDAKTLQIGAMLGSGDADYLKKFGFHVDEVTTQDLNLKKLTAKRIDVWATDNLSALYFSKKEGVVIKESLVFRKTLSSLACSTSMPSQDVEKLQTTLDDMIKDGTIDKITAKNTGA